MTRFLTLLVAGAAAAGSAAAGTPPPGVYGAEPPAEVAGLLDQLRRGEGRTSATNALAARDGAAPYLRRELVVATERAYRRDLTEALAAIDDRIRRRTLDRAKEWAAGGRIDLLTDLLAGCPDEDAGAVARHVDAVQLRLRRALTGALPPHPGGGRPPVGFLWPLEVADRRVSGDDIVTPPQLSDGGFVRARRATIGAYTRGAWLVAAGTELREAEPVEGSPEWLMSVVLANGPLQLHRVTGSLVVCDGDLDLTGTGTEESLVLANGTVTVGRCGLLRRSMIWAGGDIVLTPEAGRALGTDVTYLARGVVRAPRGVTLGRGDRGGARCPFGVRFLDPAEFGLDLDARNGGVQVMGIEPWSPFTRYGVADADIVTGVDGEDVRTVPEFRRALRRGVLRESVVLTLRRDGRRLTRVVFLDGVPTAPAPPPREVPPKPPTP